MKKEIKRTSLLQTGIAVALMEDNSYKNFPMFSTRILAEALDIKELPNVKDIVELYRFNSLGEIHEIIEELGDETGSYCMPEKWQELGDTLIDHSFPSIYE